MSYGSFTVDNNSVVTCFVCFKRWEYLEYRSLSHTKFKDLDKR